MKNLIAQGAEAKIFKAEVNGQETISKERVPKEYRIKILDEKIRKARVRREFSIMKKASSVIPVPKIISHDENNKTIIMEFIDGKKLAECLDDFDYEERLRICKLIGKQTALLHNQDIIHGDLTTSNMILKNREVYFIDFGLSFIDSKIEHKAVDLHLLKQAIESKHYKHFESSFNEIIKSYLEHSNKPEEIKKRLGIVQERGKYKKKNKQ